MNFVPSHNDAKPVVAQTGDDGILARFVRRNFRAQGAPLLLSLAFATGLCSGVTAWLFKLAIAWLSRLVTAHLRMEGMNPWLVAVPVAGICLSGLFMRKILKRNISDGTERIKNALASNELYLRPRRIIAPLLASTVTLGFGGSAGSEGPIASSGAAIGSNLGRIFGVDSSTLRLLVAIGSGAGIAAIFKAPVGGMFFVIEWLAIDLSALAAVALAVACLAGGMVAYALDGGHTDLDYMGIISFDSRMMLVAVILGAVCGIYSLYYSRVMDCMRRRLSAISRPWVRNLIAGLTIGILLFVFPTLYGEGYGAIGHIVNGIDSTVIKSSPFAALGHTIHAAPLIPVVAGILLAKCWACGATVYGGGVAGEFAPTLFAGAMAGLLFGIVANLIPGVDIPTAHCALFAMAGAMAGIIKAPFMAIFIATEMTGSYASLLPISICAVCSYFTVWLVTTRFFGSKKK